MMNSRSLVLLSLSALSSVVAGEVSGYNVNKIFTLSVEDTEEKSPYPLMAWLPPDYNKDPNSLHPCVLTIQGKGEWDDPKLQISHGPLRFINKGRPEAFIRASAIAISPAIPSDFDLRDASVLERFVEYVLSEFKVDPDRLSMVGLSFGGGVVWAYGKAYGAKRLSMLAPSSANTNPFFNDAEDYDNCLQLNIWAFHTHDDYAIPQDIPVSITGYFSGDNEKGQEGWMGGIAEAEVRATETEVLSSSPSMSRTAGPTSGPTSGPTPAPTSGPTPVPSLRATPAPTLGLPGNSTTAGLAGNSTRMLEGVSTRMLDNYPVDIFIDDFTKGILPTAGGSLISRSSSFSVEEGWVWNDGLTFVAGKRHQMTLVGGGSYNSHWKGWMDAWGKDDIPNNKFWRWLFEQKRGELPTAYGKGADEGSSSSTMVHPSWTTTACGVLAALFALSNF